MSLVALDFLLALLPAAWVLRRIMGSRSIPAGAALRAVAAGALAIAPAALAEGFAAGGLAGMPAWLIPAFRAFVIAGLCEEAAKLAAATPFARADKEGLAGRGLVRYAICASLGFAAFENLLYASPDPWVMIARGLTAFPLHASTGALLGAATAERTAGGRTRAGGLALAVAIHGLYDYLLFLSPPFSWFSVPLPLLSSLYAWNRHKALPEGGKE